MKKILILFSFILCIQHVFSQREQVDSLLQRITSEKYDNARIELCNTYFSTTAESNPGMDMQNARKLLQLAEENSDKIGEAMALARIGYDYRSFGSTTKSLEYNLKAAATAEELGNEKLMAVTKTYLAIIYKDQANFTKVVNG
jgi:hypothetical protein